MPRGDAYIAPYDPLGHRKWPSVSLLDNSRVSWRVAGNCLTVVGSQKTAEMSIFGQFTNHFQKIFAFGIHCRIVLALPIHFQFAADTLCTVDFNIYTRLPNPPFSCFS